MTATMGHLGSNKFTIVHVETLEALGHNFTDAFMYSWMHFRISDKNTNIVEDQGELWWSVTPREIADELGGASVDVVRRSLDRLIEGGWLVVTEHQLRGMWDRRRSYRTAQPCGNNPTRAEADLPNLPISTKEINKPEKRSGYSEEFELWWKTFPKAPGRTPASKSAAWSQYKRVAKQCGDAHLLSQLDAYVQTVESLKYIKNPDKWLKENLWEVEFEVVVNPLDEAVANRDFQRVEVLTGVRFREPDGLVSLPLSERSVARVEAFDVWAVENRERLVAGWRSKALA